MVVTVGAVEGLSESVEHVAEDKAADVSEVMGLRQRVLFKEVHWAVAHILEGLRRAALDVVPHEWARALAISSCFAVRLGPKNVKYCETSRNCESNTPEMC